VPHDLTRNLWQDYNRCSGAIVGFKFRSSQRPGPYGAKTNYLFRTRLSIYPDNNRIYLCVIVCMGKQISPVKMPSSVRLAQLSYELTANYAFGAASPFLCSVYECRLLNKKIAILRA